MLLLLNAAFQQAWASLYRQMCRLDIARNFLNLKCSFWRIKILLVRLILQKKTCKKQMIIVYDI